MALRSIGRREFGAALGATAAYVVWPAAGRAQQPAKVWQIGMLYPGLQAIVPSRINAFTSGLQTGGLRPDQFEVLVRASDGDPTLLGALASDLVSRKVDVIFAVAPAGVRAARAATGTIPIVAGDLESDPLSTGFIASNVRPGGNLTGTYLDFPDFSKKWLEVLKETVPQATRVAVIWDTATGRHQLKAVEAAADILKFALVVLEVRRAADLDVAIQSAAQQGAGALVMLSSPLIGSQLKHLAGLALMYHMPAITLFTDFARNGGLMAYGPSLFSVIRQCGIMAARILRGARPAETPIETPAKFEFVLNLKTATALGLTIPASVLLRADEVIE